MKSNWRTILLILGVALIIFGAPWLLTLPTFCDRFNYETTGAIGDTIGGLTGPFINGLGAILVYIAFREQVKANKLLSSREQERDILEQINSIKADQNEEKTFEKTVGEIIDKADRMTWASRDLTMAILLDKAFYFLSEFVLAIELLKKYQGDKEYPKRKLQMLFTIRYREHTNKLYKTIHPRTPIEGNNHTMQIIEITSTINELRKYFNDEVDDLPK